MILDFGKLYKIDFIDHTKGKQDNVCLLKKIFIHVLLFGMLEFMTSINLHFKRYGH